MTMRDPNPATPRPVAAKVAREWYKIGPTVDLDRHPGVAALAEFVDAAITADPLLSAAGEMAEALKWYGEKAEALQRYGARKPPNGVAMEAIVTEMMLDDGAKARAALKRAGIE